jgi:hypothetical protein
MPPMPRLPRPPRHRGGQVPQSAGSVSTRSPASAASGLPGRKAIVIFGYDYDGWTMDPAIEAFETLASERVVLGDRHEAAYDHLVHPVHQRGRRFAWEVMSRTETAA